MREWMVLFWLYFGAGFMMSPLASTTTIIIIIIIVIITIGITSSTNAGTVVDVNQVQTPACFVPRKESGQT